MRWFAKPVYLRVTGVRIPHSPQRFFFVFIHMEWEYDRHKIEFSAVMDLLKELNALGADGWEIIHYQETKPKKFGDKYETIIIVKRLKPACHDQNQKST